MAKTRAKPPPKAPTNGEVVPIEQFLPDPANLRIHPEPNRDTVVASLKRLGAGRSVVSDGNDIIRGGNLTLQAAKQAGITKARVIDSDGSELIVVRRKDWSETEATAYGIVDNRSTDQSTFDEPALAQALKAMQADGLELSDLGYSQAELDGMFERLDKFEPEEEPEPDTSEPAGEPPPSLVRMVSLFLNVKTLPEFQRYVERLGAEYETDTPTDTVMECMRRAAAALDEAAEA